MKLVKQRQTISTVISFTEQADLIVFNVSCDIGNLKRIEVFLCIFYVHLMHFCFQFDALQMSHSGKLNKQKWNNILKNQLAKASCSSFFRSVVREIQQHCGRRYACCPRQRYRKCFTLYVTFKEASEVNEPLLATIPTKYLKNENVKKQTLAY